MGKLSRREWLGTATAALATTSFAPHSAGRVLAAEPTVRKRTLRLAHMTDIHIQPELRAGQGMAAALRHVQQQSDKPELIVTGGDSVMDSFAATRDRTQLQWDLWHQVFKDECSLPVESCIGNHDVWGWDNRKSGVNANDPRYGKAWAEEALHIAKRYRSFDRAGWHFIFLDSIHPGRKPNSYIGQLDEEQFSWLAADLAATPATTPTLVVSHIPIISAAIYRVPDVERSGDHVVPAGAMHIDARRLGELFALHPQVKVCLSGHLHMVDRVELSGVTYLCNGAVCGGWWQGPNLGVPEGYALVDLYDDGTCERQYVPYGWQAQAS